MDGRSKGLLGAIFGDMEYMIENRDEMARQARLYNELARRLGQTPTERPIEGLRGIIPIVSEEGAQFPQDINEDALDARDLMRIIEGRAEKMAYYRPERGLGYIPSTVETMSEAAGGVEGLRRYLSMLREIQRQSGQRGLLSR